MTIKVLEWELEVTGVLSCGHDLVNGHVVVVSESLPTNSMLVGDIAERMVKKIQADADKQCPVCYAAVPLDNPKPQ